MYITKVEVLMDNNIIGRADGPTNIFISYTSVNWFTFSIIIIACIAVIFATIFIIKKIKN